MFRVSALHHLKIAPAWNNTKLKVIFALNIDVGSSHGPHGGIELEDDAFQQLRKEAKIERKST